MHFESSLTPAEALRELKNQHALVECAIALLGHADNVPEIRKAKTLLDNWSMHFEMLVDELSPLLCLSLIKTQSTYQDSPRINPHGN